MRLFNTGICIVRRKKGFFNSYFEMSTNNLVFSNKADFLSTTIRDLKIKIVSSLPQHERNKYSLARWIYAIRVRGKLLIHIKWSEPNDSDYIQKYDYLWPAVDTQRLHRSLPHSGSGEEGGAGAGLRDTAGE